MHNETRLRRAGAACILLAACAAAPVGAQEAPLSAIDWVQQEPARETDTATSGTGAELPPEVVVQRLGAEDVPLLGLVPGRVTGLAPDIWRGSDPDVLEAGLARLSSQQLPAARALFYALLLTEAEAPAADRTGDRFTLARVRALQDLGALDPALALIEQAGVTRDPAHFAAYMELALLTDAEDTACAALAAHPHLAPDPAHRIFCAARSGDWALAALLFDAGAPLGALTPADEALLLRFLDPEFAEDSEPLPVPFPDAVTPLQFRLFEALGEPLPTRTLPVAYAVADLRDLAGWKAQLDAAERLARTGALPANQLLGLYTARSPAASGGVWDRVAAVQKLDQLLVVDDNAAIAKHLPPTWEAMQSAGLAAPFAALFAPRLAARPLSGRAAQIAEQMMWIAPDDAPPALATLQANAPGHPLAEAIERGLSGEAVRPDLRDLASQKRTGEALLTALRLLNTGAKGDPSALAAALSSLQALGQAETARRAAAELYVLGPQP